MIQFELNLVLKDHISSNQQQKIRPATANILDVPGRDIELGFIKIENKQKKDNTASMLTYLAKFKIHSLNSKNPEDVKIHFMKIVSEYHEFVSIYTEGDLSNLENKKIQSGQNEFSVLFLCMYYLHYRRSKIKYFTDMKPLNFRNSKDAAARINNEMAKDTNDYITDIVDPKKLNEKTTLVLVNAVHFKGYWEHPFDVYKTKSMTFSSGQDVFVETKGMQLTAKLKYKEIKGAC